MKKDKFKKLKLEVETLEEVDQPQNCVLMLSGLELEGKRKVGLSVGAVQQKKEMLDNGLMSIEMVATGLRSDDASIQHMRVGKQAEILDYHYFQSRMPFSVVTDVQAEIFDFRKGKNIPFMVKKLEFSFGNGKKVDFTDRLSVLSLNRLAS